MPIATLARIRSSDTTVWRAATWAAPLVVQVVFAAALGVGWLLGRYPTNSDAGYSILIVATVIITTVASLLIGARLLRAESPRRRSLGLALGGAGLAAAAVGLSYALIFLPMLTA
ncbi:hypothetical protein [Mycolicibacter heraklionensis]|uniref:Uncharacterized protein n=1 Tax=Mycolicibacter heraklionensis TaxID=512402 RepID=A0AA91IWP7_9MYCO|nr:hypothetical protein [Mycolicibacter heraklionensis]OBK82659.1 hypothetical protein A5649_08380 [Mycolicibacter heraklionensis]